MQLNHFLKILIVTFSFLVFAGCKQEPLTYIELMQHPDVLHERYMSCQGVDSPECQLVKHAAQDFLALSTQGQENPELFGQNLIEAQEQLAAMQPQQPGYQALNEKINAMLAVVALTSPE
jgi:hypothetical protein